MKIGELNTNSNVYKFIIENILQYRYYSKMSSLKWIFKILPSKYSKLIAK